VSALKALQIRVKYDDNDNSRPGWKFAEYEKKGVPVRIAIGERDIENNSVEIARRDTKEKQTVSMDNLAAFIVNLLDNIHNTMFEKARAFRDTHITEVNSWEEFQKVLADKGGFLSAHWDGTIDTEARIKELSKATIRCIPLNNKKEPGKCILTGAPSDQRVLFAMAY
jgi:prolyl-tRNA synthetase